MKPVYHLVSTCNEDSNLSFVKDQEMDLLMRKLNRRLRKLFRSLPDGTLSVVVLLGHTR